MISKNIVDCGYVGKYYFVAPNCAMKLYGQYVLANTLYKVEKYVVV